MKVQIINERNENYPKRLKEIKDNPKVLYAIGDVSLLNKVSIAIVGTRDIDDYGIEQTKRFSTYLSEKGLTVVSGLAKGVDTVAHTFSKNKLGRTIAVLASGFNHIYPKENISLFNSILENKGLIVSEWEENIEVDMHRFPKRNRIISGLTVGTLVIEAKKRSGSTITAHLAMKQNREVFCVPGNIDKMRSTGTNKLIEEGANLVMAPKDIINVLEYDGFINRCDEKIENINKEFKEIYKQISTIPITANEIARKTNKKINEVNEALFMLEMDELIQCTNFGKYVLK